MATSCGQTAEDQRESSTDSVAAQKGTFAYDLHFLQQHDSVAVLRTSDGRSRVIVSPKYQAKVFTSTANGDGGNSFGWVNYKAFSGPVDPHMNGYGGENRLWLGPEGGNFSLFFKPGAEQEFTNWKTPAAIDTESWAVAEKSDQSIVLHKAMEMQNYRGTSFKLTVDRRITILEGAGLAEAAGIRLPDSVKAVAYSTDNKLTNAGTAEWTEQTGMPCIWVLDMFRPSDHTVIVVPLKKGAAADQQKAITSDYFGAIPADRLKHTEKALFFRADGKSRGKLGVTPAYAERTLGSYDAAGKVLTVIRCDIDPAGKYLTQRWNTKDPAFGGDAVNVYNDGPLADGSQMGPFYELESVSPAAFLKPGGSLSHRQVVFHFTGEASALNDIAQQLLGVSLEEINKAF